MARTLTPERQILREWAIALSGSGETQESIGKRLGIPQYLVSRFLPKTILHNETLNVLKSGAIMHNSGVIIHNFKDGLPPNPKPQFFIASSENLYFLQDNSIDIIITSPPYNLGQEKWPMGGNGRTPRQAGVGYSSIQDNMPEKDYQDSQIKCLTEFYRVVKPGGNLFYNHKVRQRDGEIIHPVTWLQKTDWLLRQEIIWDRMSTHNHTPTLFWPQDERIYWLTKGKPNLSDKAISLPSVWREFGPIPKNGDHPAPFTPALPKMILRAIAKPGDIILDPFGGQMTTCLVASSMGYKSIGIDIAEDYVITAANLFGVEYQWMMTKEI